jgi:hypothetical protein
VSWDAVSGATSYNLYRSTTSGNEGSTPYQTDITGTSYPDTGLTNGTPYYYEVTAVESGTEGPVSSEVSAAPSAQLTLTTPASAVSVNIGSDYTVDWTGGNPTDTVQVWAEGGPNNAWTELTTGVPQADGSYTWNTTGVLHGWYWFQAYDIPTSGSSYTANSPNYLHVVSTTATAPNISLTNPPLSTAAVAQGTSYTLDWTASDGSGDTNPLYVQLWVYSGNTGLWTEVPGANYLSASADSYSMSTTGLAPGWYSFAIHATNGDAWSYAASPGWLNVTLASTPVFNYTTPTSGQSVAAGSAFNLDWNITGVPAGDVSAMTVQIWAQYLNGSTPVWTELTASVNAATGTYSWNTTGASPNYYAFNVYLGYGDQYLAFASPNWLNVT